MTGMLRMVVVLSLLCGLSGFVLSWLKQETAGQIENQVLTYVQGPALLRVFPAPENSPIADRRVFALDNTRVTVFPVLRAGKLVGVALEEQGKGYGGDIGVMVGFNTADASLAGIGITTLKETPGLGMRVTEAGFLSQFPGQKDPVALSAQGGRIDGISGATISSAGVVAAVNKAAETYRQLGPQIAKAWGADSAQGGRP